MENKTIGITVIYFNDESRNIYANLPLDKDLAKRLSKRIYKDTMTALSAESARRNYLVAKLFP